MVEEHSLPVLSAELVSRAGSENTDAGKAGLATLTSEIMGDGTQSRSLEKLAAGSRADRHPHRSSRRAWIRRDVAYDLLTNHADEGMDLLADVAQHPAFRTEDLERRRKQRLVAHLSRRRTTCS